MPEKSVIIDHVSAREEWPNGEEQEIKYIILHDVKFSIKQAKEIFEQYGVSAHYYVGADGQIYELVPLTYKAYHAGASQFEQDISLNNSSIGIETESRWQYLMPTEQCESLISLLKDLVDKYGNIKILSHAEIAPYRLSQEQFAPGKTDPGINFPWKKLAAAGFGSYHQVEIKTDPQIIWHFGEQDEQILLVQQSLYKHGYHLVPQHGEYDQKTAAILTAFYLRYYPEWFSLHQNDIAASIEESNPNFASELDLTAKITDQWVFNNSDYLTASNIDYNAINIMSEILGYNSHIGLQTS